MRWVTPPKHAILEPHHPGVLAKQQYATGCANGRNMYITSNNVGSCWSKMLRPFPRSITLTCCSYCNLKWCGFLLWLLMMQTSHRQSEFCANLPHLETFTWENLTQAERVTRSGRLDYPPWRVTPPKRNQIKTRDYMDRRVTPPKRVTSLTWDPPPPCKQALTYRISCEKIVDLCK